MLLAIVIILQNLSIEIFCDYRNDYMWANKFQTFYRVHELATTWNQARQICEADGTSLFFPDSIEEMENLKILISNMKAHYSAVFIGIHDQFSKGDYVTLQGLPISGSVFELFWGEDKPGDISKSGQCVVLTREGVFDDRHCDEIFPFVCKIWGNKTSTNSKCNNFDMGYVPHNNGKCYKYHKDPLSWHDAYLVCDREQGHLAIINSAEEANVVTTFLGENPRSHAPDPNILHIGFSDLMFPYQYRTITGQTLDEAGYSSWSPAQEDVATMKIKHCGAISRTGFLKITDCNRPAMFLCETRINNTNNIRTLRNHHQHSKSKRTEH